jgi:hypothetical protein
MLNVKTFNYKVMEFGNPTLQSCMVFCREYTWLYCISPAAHSDSTQQNCLNDIICTHLKLSLGKLYQIKEYILYMTFLTKINWSNCSIKFISKVTAAFSFTYTSIYSKQIWRFFGILKVYQRRSPGKSRAQLETTLVKVANCSADLKY